MGWMMIMNMSDSLLPNKNIIPTIHRNCNASLMHALIKRQSRRVRTGHDYKREKGICGIGDLNILFCLEE